MHPILLVHLYKVKYRGGVFYCDLIRNGHICYIHYIVHQTNDVYIALLWLIELQ